MPVELNDRQRAVLRRLIAEHVRAGEPVASARLAQSPRLELSAASIRSVMAELEERGLLRQPHTSAGRVPTDAAYRLFVDELLGKPPRLSAAGAAGLEGALAGRAEIPEMLEEASRQLSRLSKQVGLVLAPKPDAVVLDRLEFLRVDGRRVVAVLVGRSGWVEHRLLEVEAAPESDQLERIGRYLGENFGGRTLDEMRSRLIETAREERAALDSLARESLALGRAALDPREQVEIFVDGTSNLLGQPEFADLGALRTLFQTLEERELLIELLDRLARGRGVQVVIGSENPLADLENCSLVTATYGPGDRTLGTVGIVGPKRMHYGRAIALVGHLALVLGRLLETEENPC